MSRHEDDLVTELARIAAEMGPALAPAGHLELLRSITDAAKDLFAAAACSLALLTDDQSELVFHVASGAGAEDVVGMRIPSSAGIAGWVVTSGQPIAIEDVRRDARFASSFAESTGYVPTSILAMPLETDRRMIGVISVLDRRSAGSGVGEANEDMKTLALFARQAALAIENSRVFGDLGRVLFEAAADASDHYSDALRAVAAGAPRPSSEYAELAAHLAELGRLGPDERLAATRLVGHFLDYLRTRRRFR